MRSMVMLDSDTRNEPAPAAGAAGAGAAIAADVAYFSAAVAALEEFRLREERKRKEEGHKLTIRFMIMPIQFTWSL